MLVQCESVPTVPHVAGGRLRPANSAGPSAAPNPPGFSKPWTARPPNPSPSSISAWVSSTSRQRQMQPHRMLMQTRPGLQGGCHFRRSHQSWKILTRPCQTQLPRKIDSRPQLVLLQVQQLHPLTFLQARSAVVGQESACRQSRCTMA